MGKPVGNYGMAPATDKRWIFLRHKTWSVALDVPRKHQKALGKARFVASLRTHDLAVAQARRWEYITKWRQIIDGHASETTQALSIVDEGLAWRDTLRRIERQDPAAIESFRSSHGPYMDEPGRPYTRQEDALGVARTALQERIEELHYDRQSPRDASALAGLAYGTATPLLAFVGAWLSEGGKKGPFPPRTAAMYRSDVERLAEWLEASGIPLLIEEVTRKVAGRWILALDKTDKKRATTNKRISAVSSYWNWLRRRQGIDLDPWSKQTLALMPCATGEDEHHRAYTDAEMTALLSGPADTEMQDAMRLAALSGMRLNEIYQLRVGDCLDDRFFIRKGKTAAARRSVPIHPDLKGVVERRLQGKAGDSFLMHEGAREDHGRSSPFSKRYTRYRIACGITDKASKDDRQDRINFHSFRHWFITQARRTNDQALVARIVGHAQTTITDSRYNHGPGIEAERACVASVKLPAL